MKASFIYVNWNSTDLLVDSLNSIDFSKLPFAHELIVVDNASDSFDLDYDFGVSNHKIIMNTINQGFGAANNQGFSQSDGDIIVLINPDTLIAVEVITGLIEFIQNHKDIAVAGPELVDLNGIREISIYPPINLMRETFRLFKFDKIYPLSVYDLNKMDLSVWQSVGSVQGACMAIRRDALEDDFIFDDDYFMFSEEVDLCHRLRSKGWEIAWLPYFKIVHLGGQSTKIIEDEMFIELYLSKLTFFNKWYGGLTAFAFRVLLLIAALIRILLIPFVIILSSNNEMKVNYRNLHRKYTKLFKKLFTISLRYK